MVQHQSSSSVSCHSNQSGSGSGQLLTPPLAAGEMLSVAEPFLEQQLHPTTIINAYLQALDDMLSITRDTIRSAAPPHGDLCLYVCLYVCICVLCKVQTGTNHVLLQCGGGRQ